MTPHGEIGLTPSPAELAIFQRLAPAWWFGDQLGGGDGELGLWRPRCEQTDTDNVTSDWRGCGMTATRRRSPPPPPSPPTPPPIDWEEHNSLHVPTSSEGGEGQ